MMQVQIRDYAVLIFDSNSVELLQNGNWLDGHFDTFVMPISKLIIEYTSDAIWLCEQLAAAARRNAPPKELYDLIQESKKRPNNPIPKDHPTMNMLATPQGQA